jgi:hypothetical protein
MADDNRPQPLWRCLFFPEPPRTLPGARVWNMALRTAHLAAMGVLLGGHVFDLPPERLLAWLYAAAITGAGLAAVEAYPSCSWCYEGRGVTTLAKLLLLLLVPWLWRYRVALLAVVVVLGSVGSHMPYRYRHFSLLHGRVVAERRSSAC